MTRGQNLILIMFVSLAAICAVCVSQEPVEVAAAGATYSYGFERNPVGAWPGLTQSQTNVTIAKAFRELSAVSGLKVVPWNGKGSPTIVISFRSINWFKAQYGFNPGAVMDGKNLILNNERVFNQQALPRIFENLVIHEMLHFLKFQPKQPADAWNHHRDNACMSSINLSNYWFCQEEILWLQWRYGKPAVEFDNLNRVRQQVVVDAVTASLRSALDARNAAVYQKLDILAQRAVRIGQQTAHVWARDNAISIRDSLPAGAEKQHWNAEANKFHAWVVYAGGLITELSAQINVQTDLIQASQTSAVRYQAELDQAAAALNAIVAAWKHIPMIETP